MFTGWFRTTNTAAVAAGTASKNTNMSYNGWGLLVQNGHLRALYSQSFSNRAMDATSAAAVVDGFLHHAAMVVDGSGGKLFLGGVQVGSGTWIDPVLAGPITTSELLLIGRYLVFESFLGDIDEVTVGNRALGVTELNYLKHRHPNGSEDGWGALWHLDENSGAVAGDATGHGYLGKLINSPAWVGSSAPMVFNPVSSNALQFDGLNGYVQVAHTNDLNPYPFASTA